jgi:deoxyribodipyrimidine photo-lyase
MSALVWFRRDLRLHDHPALHAASSAQDGAVVPVFCFDPALLEGRHRSGPRTQFLLDCLSELDESLRARGSRLVIRIGPPEREIPALAADCGADVVHVTSDVGPFATRRDRRVARALVASGCELVSHPGAFVVDDAGAIRTGAGEPYSVFTPFYRKWSAAPRRAVLRTPREMPPIPSRVRVGRLPSLEELGFRQELSDPMPGGEQAAAARARAFLTGPVHHYERDHDTPSRARGTSRLSRAAFDAWRGGQTGYPLVDAGMRELLREGWMHNRVRMVVGSFLTKHLGIDWRWGERWFMRMLLDGDEANNNGNWQWIASVGVDPQPPYRRIYNPARQQQRFDPDGSYVRANVPELHDVPDRYLAEPWTMPADLQRDIGCVIGTDYPAPVVDHASARRQALDRYASVAR